MRNADHAASVFEDAELTKRIYQARPNLVLNIGNEYLAMGLMKELKQFYVNSSLNMPQRHIHTRFARDFKEFTLESFDWAHYTVPLSSAAANGFTFPGECVG